MGADPKLRRILVMGATGFVGRALVPALVDAGYVVRATSRDVSQMTSTTRLEWMRCDIGRREEVARALEGVGSVFFLVHAMGGGARHYAGTERESAETLRDEAARASVERIVYLGGVAPRGEPSEHLKSRLAVGDVLRGGPTSTIELRASMIVGNGSASWQIVRDLAMRLPAMLLPSWTASRTCPIALDDVVVALVRALDVPLPKSAYYDIPGPDTVSGRQILSTIAALRGRRVPSVPVPFLSVSLSSWWLKLVTRADFSIARELVLGFKEDLLPIDDRYWAEIEYTPRWSFEAAAKKALSSEPIERSVLGAAGRIEEAVVHLLSPKRRSTSATASSRSLQNR